MTEASASGAADLAAFLPLFRDLVFLKRVRSAGRVGSVAQRLFLQAWAALAQGAEIAGVMQQSVGAALTALRMGDLDAEALRDLGVDPAPVLRRARAAFANLVDPCLLHAIEVHTTATRIGDEPPPFARALADQPRAGITSPGLPRVALAYTENHAEHCLSVAVGGAVLAAHYGADASAVFLAALAHHFHNAAMADSGFAGEIQLGDLLAPAMASARARAYAQLPAALAQSCRDVQQQIETDDTPLARAFHAADVLDRVLEVEACLAASRLSMDDALHRYALVHAGPVKPFHDRVLHEAGLAC